VTQGKDLRFCCGPGPCGDSLYRQIIEAVIAASSWRQAADDEREHAKRTGSMR
jgi:hypothetical protein